MAVKPNAQGEIIQASNARPIDVPLPKGLIEVKITDVFPENGRDEGGNGLPSENYMVSVKYPNGAVQQHQHPVEADVAHLVTKIRNKIKGYYGHENIGDLKTKLPKDVVDLVGETLIFGGLK